MPTSQLDSWLDVVCSGFLCLLSIFKIISEPNPLQALGIHSGFSSQVNETQKLKKKPVYWVFFECFDFKQNLGRKDKFEISLTDRKI